MEISTVNQVITASSGILGAIVGAGISALVTLKVNKKAHEHEKSSFEAGFIAEVSALQMIIKSRKYLQQLEEISKHPSILTGETVKLKLMISENYAPFYYANISKIGLLSDDKTKKLVKYHSLLSSLSQDFRSESFYTQNGFDLNSFEEMKAMLSVAIHLGNELTS